MRACKRVCQLALLALHARDPDDLLRQRDGVVGVDEADDGFELGGCGGDGHGSDMRYELRV